MANFPYQPGEQGALLQPQAILGGVATSTSDGYGAFRVSSIFAGTVTATSNPLSADSSRVSVVQGDAGVAHVSAFQTDAGNLMVSGKSQDAALFRVSAIGGTAGDRTIVDGTTQTISATLTPISASPATTTAGLVVNSYAPDAGKFRVSAIGGTTGDHTLVDGTTQTISATLTPISASPAGSTAGLVTNDFQSDAGKLLTSAKQGDANLLHASAFVDSGSVSARSGDANQVHVSATQLDAGLLLVSGKQGDANLFHVSAVQGDGSLFRTSSLNSVVTTNTGGASLFSTSGGIAQTSVVKSAAGRLYGYHLGNPAGVDQYLQVFNASGGATLGTDVPALTLVVPAGTGSNQGSGAIMSLGPGIGFSNGIQVAVTSTATGNTAGASAMRVNVFYA